MEFIIFSNQLSLQLSEFTIFTMEFIIKQPIEFIIFNMEFIIWNLKLIV